MRQHSEGVDLESSLGYLLKEAATALRTAMEAALHPLGMTVTHYACLELLAQRPGLSSADLARGTFVTRQSMNVLLQTLARDGEVVRPPDAPSGRALPATLTPLGRARLAEATVRVRAIEQQMLAGLSDRDEADARRILSSMVGALAKMPAQAQHRSIPEPARR